MMNSETSAIRGAKLAGMDNSPSGQYANSPKKNRFMPEGDSPMISPTDDSQEFAATGASSAAIAAPAKRKYKKRVMKGKRARLSPTTVYVALHRGMSPDNPFIRVLGIFTDKKMAEDKLEEAEDEDIAASLEKKQAEEQKEDEDDPENDDMLGEEKEKIIAGRDFPRHQDDFFYVHTVTTAAGIKAYVVLEERSDGGNDSNACRVQGAFGKVDEANEWARVQFTDVREEMDLLDASEHNFSSPERRSPSASPASGGGTPRVAKNKNEEFLFSWGGRRRSKRFRKKDKDERVFGETFWKAPSGDKGVKLYAAIARVCPEGGGEDELERIVFVEEHDIQRPPDKPFEDWETCSESDDEEKKLQEALEAQQAEKKLMEKRIAKMDKLVKDAAEADAYAKSLAVKLIEAKQADEADVKKKQEESLEIEELHVGVLKRARDAAAQVLKYAEAVEQSEAALVASNNAAESANHKVAMSKSKALKAALEEKRIDKELQQAVERLNPVEMALDRLNSKIRGGNVNPDELTEALNDARAAKRAIVVEEVRQVRDRAENVIKQKQDRIKNAKRDAKLKAAEARYRANYKAKQQQLREEREIARLKEQQEKLKEAARLKREQEKANQKKIIKAARQRAKAVADAEKEAKKKALKLEKKKIKLEKKKEKEAALNAIKKEKKLAKDSKRKEKEAEIAKLKKEKFKIKEKKKKEKEAAKKQIAKEKKALTAAKKKEKETAKREAAAAKKAAKLAKKEAKSKEKKEKKPPKEKKDKPDKEPKKPKEKKEKKVASPRAKASSPKRKAPGSPVSSPTKRRKGSDATPKN